VKKKLLIDNKLYELEVNYGKKDIEVTFNNKTHNINISDTTFNGFHSILIDNKTIEVFCQQKGEDHFVLWIGQNTYEVKSGEALLTESQEEESSVIHAPMPGLIAKLEVKEGDEVSKGTPILILEAMKMQNEIKSPRDGVVKEILVKEGAKVASEDKLVVLE